MGWGVNGIGTLLVPLPRTGWLVASVKGKKFYEGGVGGGGRFFRTSGGGLLRTQAPIIKGMGEVLDA